MKKLLKTGITLFILITTGYIIPVKYSMPVVGANKSDYNKDSFWHYPWGQSITHKGVDIFAKKGTPVHSSTLGLVLYAGQYGKGGKFVIILGPKWRLHYYAHLNTIEIKTLRFVTNKTMIGTVGNTGNAKTTPTHLHYSIATIIPYPWRIDKERQGYLKMFYLNPSKYL